MVYFCSHLLLRPTAKAYRDGILDSERPIHNTQIAGKWSHTTGRCYSCAYFIKKSLILPCGDSDTKLLLLEFYQMELSALRMDKPCA